MLTYQQMKGSTGVILVAPTDGSKEDRAGTLPGAVHAVLREQMLPVVIVDNDGSAGATALCEQWSEMDSTVMVREGENLWSGITLALDELESRGKTFALIVAAEHAAHVTTANIRKMHRAVQKGALMVELAIRGECAHIALENVQRVLNKDVSGFFTLWDIGALRGDGGDFMEDDDLPVLAALSRLTSRCGSCVAVVQE